MGVRVATKVEFARTLRRGMTDAEQRLWKHLRLRNINGFKFRRQHDIGQFIVDFVCIEKRLVVEIDGGQHADAEAYDSARTQYLEGEGFQVLRFWNNEVLEKTNDVLEVIWKALHGGQPPSQPSPWKGEGENR